MACCIANRTGLCYAASIPSEMLAPQDTGEAQEEVKVIIYRLCSPSCYLLTDLHHLHALCP